MKADLIAAIIWFVAAAVGLVYGLASDQWGYLLLAVICVIGGGYRIKKYLDGGKNDGDQS
ncbi:MAG: hypothetical protein LUH09_06170 [Clostridiales bacterium]|nr:hypothetical protein [Clostridiales bacterium]MCD7802474.1 hypothetical protein [Clostridiales bacterium]